MEKKLSMSCCERIKGRDKKLTSRIALENDMNRKIQLQHEMIQKLAMDEK